ncbi:DUF1844 domain-containing protein [Myxococcota bacterium]|nr:DUF1844 domain-containing protein [Myxococcota bacterium]MBU1429856.1 DUF1844 domain-containing protein [Myxococcota bacterium]MBU1896466.1 DUF1844 domain-containing protein [Myxococcota bacterium]
MGEKRIFQTDPQGQTRVEPCDALGEEGAATRCLKEMSFSTHILSLSAAAEHYLSGAEGAVDLPSAAHLIDTLAMLQDKTQGNLDGSERRLLAALLQKLRAQYIKLR